MQKRTKQTSVSDKVRKEVLERDKGCCVACGDYRTLTIAHVFVNRSHGGLGVKENLATLCMKCHHDMDNGKKTDQEFIRAIVQTYMIDLYGMIDIKKLKYTKWDDLPF